MNKALVFWLGLLCWAVPSHANEALDAEDADVPGLVGEAVEPQPVVPVTPSASTQGDALITPVAPATPDVSTESDDSQSDSDLGLMEAFDLPKPTKGGHYSFTLRQAIQRALDYNRPFQTTKSSLRKTDLALRDSRASFRPQLRLSAVETLSSGGADTAIDRSTSKDSVSASLSERLWSGTELGASLATSKDRNPAARDKANSSSMGLSITQPLTGANSPRFARESLTQAQRRWQYDQNRFAQSKRNQILSVTREYYNTVTQLQYYEINKKSLERLSRLLEATKERTKVGLAAQLDVSRVEGEVSSQRQTMNAAKRQLEDQLDTMRLLLGLSLDDEVVLLDEIVDQPMDFDFSRVFEIAWANRTDYLDQQRQVEDEARQLRIAKQKWWPELSLTGRYDASHTADSFRGSLASTTQGWSVGMTAGYTFPVSTVGRAIASAEIDLQNARRGLEEQREQIVREIKMSVRAVQESKARVGTTTERVKQAEKRRAIATFRFEKGAADNLEVVLAEEQLLRARNEYATAVKDHLMAQSELKNTLGILKVDE